MNDRNCDEVLHKPAWDALRLTVKRVLDNRKKKTELQTNSEENASSQQNGEVQYTVDDTLPPHLLAFLCRNPWRRQR